MMAIEDTKTDPIEAVTDSIESDLAAAIAEHQAKNEETTAKEVKAKDATADKDTSDASETKEATNDEPQAKDEKGASEAKTDETEKDAEASEGDKSKPSDKSEREKAEDALTGRWSAKDKATFKALAPEGKDLLLRRAKEMEAAFTKKSQDIAGLKREFEPVQKLFEPWQDRMKQAGYTPQSLITAWYNVEKRLMEGDGVNVIAGLVKGYKLDLGKVAQALGIRPMAAQRAETNGEAPPEAQANGNGHAIQLPPELVQQLQSIQERLETDDRRRADEQRRAQMGAEQRVMSEIEQFKSSQDAAGNLLYPHFDDLEDDMTSLARAAVVAKKPIPALKELYEKALWSHPSLREAQLAAREKALREQAETQAKAKAAAAKKAGSSVTGAPGSGPAPLGKRSPGKTLEEELRAAVAERESAI